MFVLHVATFRARAVFAPRSRVQKTPMELPYVYVFLVDKLSSRI